MSISSQLPQPQAPPVNPLEFTEEPEELEDGVDDEHEAEDEHEVESERTEAVPPMRIPPLFPRRRRLSTYESQESIMNLEDDEFGGSARPRSAARSAASSPILSRRSASELNNGSV